MPVSAAMPDDVQVFYRALQACLKQDSEELTLDVGNCGTAARFLTAFCAQRPDKVVVLRGVERMHHRPIGQLVDALRKIGADIEYLGDEGFPPLRIKGKVLNKHRLLTLNNPQSTQFISALLMIGVEVQTDSSSPYIHITRMMKEQYALTPYPKLSSIESDWSSAAFWYEYIALHGGTIMLCGLSHDSMQGDKIVADIFAHLGVHTEYTNDGIILSRLQDFHLSTINFQLTQDFASCPDLYPAVALSCERLGVKLYATGTDSLPMKESDRLRAVREHRTDHDHRMAMALMIAGYKVDDMDCIRKSYPQFIEQYNQLRNSINQRISIIVPRRGINDEGKGKKHALYRLISAAETEYVWMQDEDVVFANLEEALSDFCLEFTETSSPDMLILPLRMEAESETPTLLERLQIAEYAAIQQLTIESAKRGKPVMCSGANMIVHRNRWLESYSDLHPEILSGDDMFLLESFKRRGLRIIAYDDPRYEAIVRPHTSWKDFWKQRMRWAGKAPKYTDKDILACGTVVIAANIFQLFFPPIIFVKFPIEYHLIKQRDKSVSFLTALLLELVYPFYCILSLIGGLFRHKW